MIKISERIEKTVELSPYCLLAKEDDCVSVSEWGNGEGWDVCINARGNTVVFSVTHGEFQAINMLINYQTS